MATKLQLRQLKEQTQAIENDACPVSVAPVSWMAWGEVETLYKGGEVVGFYNVSVNDDSPIDADTLPVEFFNHEILGFDGTTDAARAFVGRFGAPYSPDESTIQSDDLEAFYRDVMRGAVALPDDLAAAVRSFVSEHGNTRNRLTFTLFRDSLTDRVISLAEIARSLETLKNAFRSILAAMDAEIPEPNAQGFYDGSEPLDDTLLFAVNSWADNADMVTCGTPVVYPAAYMGAFLGAVCSQFIAAMKDPEPWRRCRCCGRLFKRKVNLTEKQRFTHPKRAARDLITFCSVQHAGKFNKRIQRSR